ncbi:MAG: phytanoyl-CoA dioxygenase family protein [Candidatus Binatia bacterium]
MDRSTDGPAARGAGDNRFSLRAPTGDEIAVPIEPEDEPAAVSSAATGRAHFEEHGYVLLRGFLDPARCDVVLRAFESHVKPYPGPLQRYPTSAAECSRYDERGHIQNGLMGAHRWPEPELQAFTRVVADLVGAGGTVAAAASELMGAPAVLIDTFYFEINGNTTPHRDIDFLPSAERIVVMWMAFEDIAPGAGRLYLYPGTHRDHAPLGAHSIVTAAYSEDTLAAARRSGAPASPRPPGGATSSPSTAPSSTAASRRSTRRAPATRWRRISARRTPRSSAPDAPARQRLAQSSDRAASARNAAATSAAVSGYGSGTSAMRRPTCGRSLWSRSKSSIRLK